MGLAASMCNPASGARGGSWLANSCDGHGLRSQHPLNVNVWCCSIPCETILVFLSKVIWKTTACCSTDMVSPKHCMRRLYLVIICYIVIQYQSLTWLIEWRTVLDVTPHQKGFPNINANRSICSEPHNIVFVLKNWKLKCLTKLFLNT